MRRKRFDKHSASFYGRLRYEQAVPKDYFLVVFGHEGRDLSGLSLN